MVKLPQYGGEGKEHYKGNKNDSKLHQHGGEMKEGSKEHSLINPKGKDYCGPGRYLKEE